MHPPALRSAILAALLTAVTGMSHANDFGHPDHYEFDASINAAFRVEAGRFPIRLHFDYPGAGERTAAAWVLESIARDGRVVARSTGMTRLAGRHVIVPAWWNGRDMANRPAPAGYYTLRLRAVPTVAIPNDRGLSIGARVAEAFNDFGDEMVEQKLDVQLGQVAPDRVVRRVALPTAATAPRRTAAATGANGGMISAQSVAATDGLAYTVYYGNLHSQTNHSDGGGAISSCTGSQAPQAGAFGPADAYAMMRTQAKGDFLLASEHNHMYDGSTGTNTAATPASANALFNSGITAASNYNAANANFLAMYGLEWGVISNGGHLNILNPDALANWELNSSGQLIGTVNTPKSNYASLYATMKQRGWVGQFNHPATTGQFLINSVPLAFDANGAEVMALAEVLNTSAFSTNTSQTETSRSTYTGAWNILLERGYKVAPATNQDNHCANWGLSFTNRTGVLLPSGTALNTANFLAAVRARRAFATEDSGGQLVLTGNSRVMGETFANSGALTLVAHYASTNAQTAQRVQFFEGVPGRNGTVTQLYEGSDTYTFTPATGKHFYYALVTQANGLRLWSAPVWVDQGGTGGGTDTQAPTVSASESGTSGSITLSATASDNVGVSKVEFLVDGALKGTDTTSPYSMALDSTTLANGSHTLVAKAYDAAGNVGTSTGVAFSVSNTTSTPTELITNGGFESGATSWTATSGAITSSTTYPAHLGSWKMWLNGYGSTSSEYGYQTISIPSTATTVTLTFWLRIASSETTTTTAYDTLAVQVRDGSNSVLKTLATYSNINKGTSYVQRTF
ncbi:MAG: carbohydrate-binding protein CenC, partial [Lysobacter sp.]